MRQPSMHPPTPLEEPYRSRAAPPGTARYFSWLFAERECREPLLGIYALLAEWRALIDPATERGVAQAKLAWWREEVDRLSAGRPVHPISRHLAVQPRAAQTDFTPLQRAVGAAARQIAGAPVERGAQLADHCRALCGEPLLLATALAAPGGERSGMRDVDPVDAVSSTDSSAPPGDGSRAGLGSCVAALASAEYLEAAMSGYRREARAGRVAFPVDELLQAGIEDIDLSAAQDRPAVQSYLAEVRRRAEGLYAQAAAILPRHERARHRHLLVLAELGARRLRGAAALRDRRFALGDLYAAWRAARRGARSNTAEP